MNKDRLVLALEREAIPGAWQMPQGGLLEEEAPIAAAHRELQEETGIPMEKTRLVAEFPDWLAYELPQEKWSAKTGRGQVQKWFLLEFLGNDSDIRLDIGPEIEFRTWKWIRLDSLAKETVPFRQRIYAHLVIGFSEYLD